MELASDIPSLLQELRRRSATIVDFSPIARQVALYGAVSGVLIALLKLIEYKHFVCEYPSEMYGGLVALIFTAIGIYFTHW